MKKIPLAIVLLLANGCGGKVVFQDDDGAGAAGGGGAGGAPPLCGGQVCGEGNQCCCDSCVTWDLVCQAPCDPPPVACEPPYHVLNPNGNCVWSCGGGTQPDDVSNECVCQPGLVEIAVDEFGRRVCGAA